MCEKGEAVIERLYNRKDYFGVSSYLNSLGKNYFLYIDYDTEKMNLLYVNSHNEITVIPCTSLPSKYYQPDWFFCKDGKYYQVESQGMLLKLVEYDIKGLPGVSSIVNHEYK